MVTVSLLLLHATGLDPAEPYFEDTDLLVHLDPSDAQYVDVIHSDGRSILFLGAGFTKVTGRKPALGCQALSVSFVPEQTLKHY